MLSSRKAVLVGALLAGTTGILFAQASGLTRTMLGKADLSAPGREAVVAKVEVAPGVDVQKDIVAQAGFPLRVAPDVRLMDAALFTDAPLGLLAGEASHV